MWNFDYLSFFCVICISRCGDRIKSLILMALVPNYNLIIWDKLEKIMICIKIACALCIKLNEINVILCNVYCVTFVLFQKVKLVKPQDMRSRLQVALFMILAASTTQFSVWHRILIMIIEINVDTKMKSIELIHL